MSADAADTPDRRQARASEVVRAVLSGEVELDGLDELVRTAALATWSPVALVSMITDRQVTASAQRVVGTGPVAARGDHETLEDTVCVHALRADGPVRVTDARCDERVAGIPSAVQGVFGSYLGVPLRAEGDLVGVLCVYDTAPRAWSEHEETDLDELAGRVAAELARIVAEYAQRVNRDAATPRRR